MRTLNEEAFLSLLRQQEGKLYRIALAITGTDADAWDALQDAVEAALGNLDELRGGEEAFPGWIRRIVVNRSINLLRSRRRRVLVDPFADLGSAPDPLPPPQESVAAREIWGLVKELDPEQRVIVALRYLGDLSLEEIAERLDLPLGTVKSRLHRALQRLRERMAEEQRRVVP